ncbi:MAG TPA: hypothetical protein VMV69_09250 [Pirellulales bacterium]|nr:hypothetical protein [Pirellulales bacterium]
MDCQQPPKNGWPAYVPSPEVIAAETARIRAGWDEAEYRHRAGFMPDFGAVDLQLVLADEWEMGPAW